MEGKVLFGSYNNCPFPNLWKAEPRQHVCSAEDIVPVFLQMFPKPLIMILKVAANQLTCVFHDHNVYGKCNSEFCRAADQTIPMVVSEMILRVCPAKPCTWGTCQKNRNTLFFW